MSDFWNWFFLLYASTGFIWSIWALYMQYKLYGKKNLIKAWAFNFIGWPVSLGILAYKKWADKYWKWGDWYWEHKYATVPVTIILGVLLLVMFIVIGVSSCEIKQPKVDNNPVIERVQLGKVIEGWYIQDNDNTNGRTKIQTEHLTVVVYGIRNVTRDNKAYIANYKNGDKFLCLEDEAYCWNIY